MGNPWGARRSQGEPGAREARESQEEPGGANLLENGFSSVEILFLQNQLVHFLNSSGRAR